MRVIKREYISVTKEFKQTLKTVEIPSEVYEGLKFVLGEGRKLVATGKKRGERVSVSLAQFRKFERALSRRIFP